MDHINKFTNSSACWNLDNMAMEAPNSHDTVLNDHHHMIQHHPSDHSIPMWPPSFPLLLPSASSSVPPPPPEPTPWSLLSTPTPTTSTQDHHRHHDHYQDQLMMLSSSNNGNQIWEDHHQEDEEEEEELGAMKEMMYKIAAMQPVDIDPATIRKPKRRNVRISDDPQSVAARHRRERISEKIRILQRLVPGGTKMDTASMLDEAIRYVKFLKRQIRHLQSNPASSICIGPSLSISPSVVGASSSSSPAAARLGFGGHGHNQNLSFNHEVIND